MSISAYLRGLLCRNQNLIQYDRFNNQAALCFAESEQGFVDVRIDSPKQIEVRSGELGPSGNNDTLTHESNIATVERSRETPAYTRMSSIKELRDTLRHVQYGRQMFFIRQRNSRSRLSVSRDMFETICEERKVFAKVRDVVMLFGIRKSEVYAQPPAPYFAWLSINAKADEEPAFPGFELAYTLRLVEDNQRSDGIRWSLRQCGIYHKVGLSPDISTWLFLALTPSLESNLDQYLHQTIGELSDNAFEVHYILLDAALSGWPDCITYLAEEVQKQSDIAFMAEIEIQEVSFTRLEERQYLKKLEDFISDLLLAMEHMIASISEMANYFVAHRSQSDPFQGVQQSLNGVRGDDLLRAAFLRRQHDALQYQKQLAAVQQKVQSVSSLVSNILDLSNGEALKVLAVETKVDNARTTILTQKAVEDAATVKVLTIITLIYLPLTVVTNFFSTSFVKSQSGAAGMTTISVTSDIWILFAVGVPLTVVTIYLWWVFSHKEIKGVYPYHMVKVKKHVVGNLSMV